MMTHEEASGLLDAYVDGELESSVIREVEAHLNLCPECRQALASLGSLLDGATALRARVVQPKRDLWPGIARRLAGHAASADAAQVPAPEDEAGRARVRAVRTSSWWRAWLGAFPPSGTRAWIWGAALVLVVASLYTVQQRRDSGRERALAGVEGLSTVSTEAAMAQADLQTAIKSRGGTWPSEGAAFQQSLQMLDQAIRDSRAAVEANPRDQGRQRSLLMIYQKQLDLLRWATKVVHQS